jgi:hypothetical protein
MSSLFYLSSLRTWLSILAIAAFSLVQFSCSSGEEPTPELPQPPTGSGEKKITSFTIEGFETELKEQGIVINVPVGTDVSKLTPTIVVSQDATIKPASGTAQNFSGTNPVRYTVTAANGTTAIYDVVVKYQQPLQMFSLTTANHTYEGVIDYNKKEISVTIDYTDVVFSELAGSNLTIKATVLKGYSITPANGATMLQAAPVDPQITNETTGEVVSYHLRLLNSENDLHFVTLKFPGIYTGTTGSQGAMNAFPEDTQGLADTDLVIHVLPGDDVSSMVPELLYSKRATVSPAPSQAQNFNTDVTYTVTSESGVAKTYKVRVLRDDFITSGNGNKYLYYNVKSGGNLLLYQRCSGKIITATLVSHATGTQYTVPSEDYSVDATDDSGTRNFLRLTAPADLPLETYRLDLTLEGGKVISTRTKIRVE